MQHNKQTLLLLAILIGAIGGIFCGWFFGEAMVTISWVGTFFLNALKMTIIPLIIAAVITGVASLGDIRKLGKVGGLTVLYYASTTAIAVFIGLVIVNIIQPGSNITDLPTQTTSPEPVGFTDIILSL
ncbi:MAG: cation:dicarboxylase symporter family transporter, partial [Gammaproteobacteria bacterium]